MGESRSAVDMAAQIQNVLARSLQANLLPLGLEKMAWNSQASRNTITLADVKNFAKATQQLSLG